MNEIILNKIEAVARRLRRQTVLRAAARGMARGAWMGIVVGLALLYFCPGPWRFVSPAVALAFPLTAALRAYRNSHPSEQAAAQIDRFYGLKDRVQTAWELIGQQRLTGIAELHLRDTGDRLAQADAAQVAPLHVPPRTVEAILLMLLLVVLVSWPWGPLAPARPANKLPVMTAEQPGTLASGRELADTADAAPNFVENLSDLGQRETIRRYFAP